MSTQRDPNGPDGCSQTPPWARIEDSRIRLFGSAPVGRLRLFVVRRMKRGVVVRALDFGRCENLLTGRPVWSFEGSCPAGNRWGLG